MRTSPETALRKRQQIAKANRTMFMWVALASALIGAAAVLSLFLMKKAIFRETVLSEKSRTVRTLEQNNNSTQELENQVRLLVTNEDLKKVLAPGEEQPIQVVLDALPDKANSSAFGAELQQRLLAGEGITLESLQVDPVAGEEQQSTSENTGSTGSSDVNNSGNASQADTTGKITFRFTVSADRNRADKLREVLTRLERSIRPIKLTSTTFGVQSNLLLLEGEGETYYQVAKTAELKDKTIKP